MDMALSDLKHYQYLNVTDRVFETPPPSAKALDSILDPQKVYVYKTSKEDARRPFGGRPVKSLRFFTFTDSGESLMFVSKNADRLDQISEFVVDQIPIWRDRSLDGQKAIM